MQSLLQVPQWRGSVVRSGWPVSAPSQLESSPHVSFSCCGRTEPKQDFDPAVQMYDPFLHGLVAPAGGGGGTSQSWPTSVGLLSMTPLQSSSLPLQSSLGAAPLAPMHCTLPPTHTFLPAVHSPVDDPQEAPSLLVGRA